MYLPMCLCCSSLLRHASVGVCMNIIIITCMLCSCYSYNLTPTQGWTRGNLLMKAVLSYVCIYLISVSLFVECNACIVICLFKASAWDYYYQGPPDRHVSWSPALVSDGNHFYHDLCSKCAVTSHMHTQHVHTHPSTPHTHEHMHT